MIENCASLTFGPPGWPPGWLVSSGQCRFQCGNAPEGRDPLHDGGGGAWRTPLKDCGYLFSAMEFDSVSSRCICALVTMSRVRKCIRSTRSKRAHRARVPKRRAAVRCHALNDLSRVVTLPGVQQATAQRQRRNAHVTVTSTGAPSRRFARSARACNLYVDNG